MPAILRTEEKTMITIQFNLPSDVEENATCECESCDKTFSAWECEPVENPQKVLKVGDVVPAGLCPHCGGLSYLLDDE